MSDGIGLAEALLGLPGFRVLSVVEADVEVVITIESTVVWAHCRARRARAEPQDRMRSMCAIWPASGGRPAAVGEAAVALPGLVVSGADVDRGVRARRRAGGVDSPRVC